MDFNEVVSEVVESVSGCIAGVIMANDGIPIADYVKPGSSVDIQALGIEYTNILKEIIKTADVLQAGEIEELTVCTDQLVFVLRLITEEYFFAIALTPDGNYGKGRYLLRLNAPRIADEF
jgi:predicted regulator of Ras-like GTPase activity (Roadblock/LC7/MglB family)